VQNGGAFVILARPLIDVSTPLGLPAPHNKDICRAVSFRIEYFTLSFKDHMESPDFFSQPLCRSDTCAGIMRQILSEVAMDLGDHVYPDSPLVHSIMDHEIQSTTTTGPDGPTTIFWCEKYGGACNFSFLLTQPKDGLPPLLTEAAFAIRGICMQDDALIRAFKRAWDSMRPPRNPHDPGIIERPLDGQTSDEKDEDTM
jgi:hypothetical protein